MSLLTDSLKTARSQVETESADEAAAIGRAAKRKEREESERSLVAALESHRDNGRAKVWRRRITTSTMADSESGRETREIAVFERAGAYSERAFLRLCNGAAAAAVNGGWSRPDAVESIGAELCARVLAKTAGRMPKRGSLGRTLGDSENPDAAYLTGMARRIIGAALAGDSRAAGLAAEAFPVAAEDGAENFDLRAAAAEAVEAAEVAPDAYLVDPIAPRKGCEGPAAPTRGDFLRPEVLTAVKRLAIETGRRTGAVSAATVSAIRPNLRAADWAESGYAKTAGSHRKNGTAGRAAMAARVTAITRPEYLKADARGQCRRVCDWTAADWRYAEAVAILAAADSAGRVAPHICESVEVPTYRAARLSWPLRKVEPDAYRVISAETFSANYGRAA